jgi:hypothetical protein
MAESKKKLPKKLADMQGCFVLLYHNKGVKIERLIQPESKKHRVSSCKV